MTGIGILGLVLLLALVVTITGWGPKGSRPASQTRLMHAARIVLMLLIVAGLGFWWRGGM